MSFAEFGEFWNLYKQWMIVFLTFDKDNSGNLDAHEMRDALSNIGIKLSNKNFNAVMLRYVDEKGAIDFEDFVVCAARLRLALKTMENAKAAPQTSGEGAVPVNVEDFVQIVIYS